MATLNLFLKTLEFVEDFGSFVSFLNTIGAFLILTYLSSYQLFLATGLTSEISSLWASWVTLVFYSVS
ncbi:MAG: hypothetical protein AAGA83_12055 [Cyanobacteria bacterium P01_F01_bin.116]